MKKNILITNDDGITSDGIVRLARAALEFGNVWVIAPAEQCSAKSHCITLRQPIEVHPHDFPVPGIKAYACGGTPADCVRIAENLMPHKPDVVMAGINWGYNMASDIQYSATVGAAFEAEFQGFLAIAFSEDSSDMHEVTDRYLSEIMAEVINGEYVPGRVININFPGCTLDEFKGILRDRKVSRLAYYKDHYNVVKSFPDGGVELMVEGVHLPDVDEGTDYTAVLENYVSIGTVTNIS